MIDFLYSVAYWHWGVLGGLFLIIELCIPASFFLWEGLAALLVGGVTFAFDFSIGTQLMIFAVSAPLFTILGRRFIGRFQKEESTLFLNKKTNQIIGNIFSLNHSLVRGQGQEVVGGTLWRLKSEKGEDFPAGSFVKVKAVENNILIVELHHF